MIELLITLSFLEFSQFTINIRLNIKQVNVKILTSVFGQTPTDNTAFNIDKSSDNYLKVRCTYKNEIFFRKIISCQILNNIAKKSRKQEMEQTKQVITGEAESIKQVQKSSLDQQKKIEDTTPVKNQSKSIFANTTNAKLSPYSKTSINVFQKGVNLFQKHKQMPQSTNVFNVFEKLQNTSVSLIQNNDSADPQQSSSGSSFQLQSKQQLKIPQRINTQYEFKPEYEIQFKAQIEKCKVNKGELIEGYDILLVKTLYNSQLKFLIRSQELKNVIFTGRILEKSQIKEVCTNTFMIGVFTSQQEKSNKKIIQNNIRIKFMSQQDTEKFQEAFEKIIAQLKSVCKKENNIETHYKPLLN